MTWKRSHLPEQSTTPIVEKSKGVRPAQNFVPASYLPLKRKDKMTDEYKVISLGKVVAADYSNFIVPAGLALDLDYALAYSWDVDGDALSLLAQAKALEVATPGTFGEVYTATDVTEGVKNFAGDLASAGEPVVISMLKSGEINYKTADPATAVSKATGAGIGFPLGITGYDIWRANGMGYTDVPSNLTYENFKMQQGLNVLTRYFIELPVVADTSGVVLAGMSVFEGSTVYPGDLVTFNKRSNFCKVSDVADIAISYSDDVADIALALDDITLDIDDIALDTTDTYADSAVNTAVNAAIAELETDVAAAVNAALTEVETDVVAAVNAAIASINTAVQGVDTAVNTAVNTAISTVNKHAGRILGRVYFVDTTYPKDYLEYVRTWNPTITGASALDKAPGTSTSGLPDNLFLAGISDPDNAKVVRINMIVA